MKKFGVSRGRSKDCQVALPIDLVRLLAPSREKAAARLRQLALIDLVRRGEVSSGWAAEQLGTNRDEFRRLLAEHNVPYLDLSEEELRQQIQAAMPRKQR